MMGPPEGAEEYLSLYDALCDADNDGRKNTGARSGSGTRSGTLAVDDVSKLGKKGRRLRGAGRGEIGGSNPGGGAAAAAAAAFVPRSIDTSERLYAW